MRTVREIRAELASVIEKRAELMGEQRYLIVKRKALLDECKEVNRARNREMLRLFDDENMSYNAIGIRCGMSAHTVKVLLARLGRSYRLRQMRQAQDKADRINAGELVE